MIHRLMKVSVFLLLRGRASPPIYPMAKAIKPLIHNVTFKDEVSLVFLSCRQHVGCKGYRSYEPFDIGTKPRISHKILVVELCVEGVDQALPNCDGGVPGQAATNSQVSRLLTVGPVRGFYVLNNIEPSRFEAVSNNTRKLVSC